MKRLLTFLILALIFLACDGKKTPKEPQPTDAVSEGVVVLDKEKLKVAGVKVKPFERRRMAQTVECNGVIAVPPDNRFSISPPIGGRVVKLYVLEGQEVRKGQALAVLQDPVYIDIQKDYLQTQSRLRLAESKRKRQKLLVEKNATTQREYEEAISEHEQLQAQKAAIEGKLRLLGLAPEKVRTGAVRDNITLRAPSDGYVQNVYVNTGLHLEDRGLLLTMINRKHMHAELQVFERDIHKIQTGQNIEFKPLHQKKYAYKATVEMVGQNVEADNKTTRVHGHISQSYPDLKPGMFIEARIFTYSDSLCALPRQAIIEHSGKSFIYEQIGEGRFRRRSIRKGLSYNELTTIENRDEFSENALPVVEGANYIYEYENR